MNLKLLVRIRWAWISYLRANLGAPFIIVFIFLMTRAATHVMYGLVKTANEIAIYAYYALVIGIILQLVSCSIHTSSDKGNKNSGSGP